MVSVTITDGNMADGIVKRFRLTISDTNVMSCAIGKLLTASLMHKSVNMLKCDWSLIMTVYHIIHGMPDDKGRLKYYAILCSYTMQL